MASVPVLVELVADAELAVVLGRSTGSQLPEGVDLVEGDGALAVELQQRQEPGDHHADLRRRPPATRKLTVPECRSRSTTIAACSRTLTAGAWRWSSADARRPGAAPGPGRPARRAASGVMPKTSSGSSCGELRLEADLPRVAGGTVGHPGREDGGDALEGAVLQQPGEEQVARLEQREVLLVLDRRPTAAAGPP